MMAREKKHLAYYETERKHVFGVFSGCKCQVSSGIPKKYTGNKRKDFDPLQHRFQEQEIRPKPLEVDPERALLLKKKCDQYHQKDKRTYSNWNEKLKLPYGEWQKYVCSHNDGYGNCEFSLKQERKDDADFQDKYLKQL